MSQLRNPRLMEIDKKVLFILLAHIPFVAFLAPIGYDTYRFAIPMTILITALVLISYFVLRGTRGFGLLTGVFLMLFSATLIQTQMGRIEMHFHIFVALAFLLIYKDWLAVVIAAGVGAFHHLLLTYLQLNQVEIAGMPIMLFNYDCSWSITFLHALFVVVESAVLIYIAMGMKKEEQISDDVAEIINQVAEKSDFSVRLQKHQEHSSVKATNKLLSSTQSAFTEINTVMHGISKGEFNQRVTHDFTGDLDVLKQAVNNSAKSVTNTMNSLLELMDALAKGDFSARLNDGVQGELKTKVDDTMQQTETVILNMIAVMNGLSKGDFGQRISAQASGELDLLKTDVNQALDNIQKAFQEINQASDRLAKGQLNQMINGNYQGELDIIKTGINAAFGNLNSLINEVSGMNGRLESASRSIASDSVTLSTSLSNQATQLQSAADTMETITHEVKQSSDSALQANQLSAKAKAQAEEGVQVMSSTIDSMQSIQESSHKIAEIVSLIDSIAFQTNLLALNAAVEAARAGEQGRGFAVVAGEVRTLAQKSADAAKEIRSLIDNTVDAIESGTGLVEKSGQSLTEINTGINQVSEFIAQIAEASLEQSNRISSLNHQIAEMDKSTQENAHIANQAMSSADSVVNEVGSLSKTVGQFETTGSPSAMGLPNKKS